MSQIGNYHKALEDSQRNVGNYKPHFNWALWWLIGAIIGLLLVLNSCEEPGCYKCTITKVAIEDGQSRSLGTTEAGRCDLTKKELSNFKKSLETTVITNEMRVGAQGNIYYSKVTVKSTAVCQSR